MLINKTSLLAHKFASTDPYRYMLQTVRIEPTRVLATDVHRAVIVSHPDSPLDEADYPVIEGMHGGKASDLVPVSLPKEVAEKCLKDIPKRTKLPILQHVQLDVGSTNANGHIKLATTDLECPQIRNVAKPDGDFPDVDRVLPKGPAKVQVHFNPRLLGESLLALSDMLGTFSKGSGGVTISIFESTEGPLVIEGFVSETGQKIKALVMPARGPFCDSDHTPVKEKKEQTK